MIASQHPQADRSEGEPALLRRLAWLNRAISSGMLALSTMGVIASFAFVCYGVFMRYLFGQPQVWVDEVVAFLLIAIVMFAVADVARRGEHIGVDILVNAMRPTTQRLMRLWSAFAMLGVAVILVYYGARTAAESREFGVVTEGYLEWPVWLVMTLMPVGGALLGLVALESALRAWLEESRPLPDVDEGTEIP